MIPTVWVWNDFSILYVVLHDAVSSRNRVFLSFLLTHRDSGAIKEYSKGTSFFPKLLDDYYLDKPPMEMGLLKLYSVAIAGII